MPDDRGNQVGRDILTQELSPPDPNGSGPGFSLQAIAGLSASIGQLAGELKAQRDQTQRLWQSIRFIPDIVVGQITSTNGNLQAPELAQPRTGYIWDVRRLTVATFTGGTVNVYRQSPAVAVDSAKLLAYTTAGTNTFGSTQLVLVPGSPLYFQAVSITGNATITMDVIEVAYAAWPAYLI